MTINLAKTILICDDEINIRESICYVVNKEGYRYSIANDGVSAYEMACNEKPDLIILDVNMPGMTGYEVCKKIRANPAIENITILILTAFGQESDKQKAISAGTDDFMSKPFSPRELRNKITELFGEQVKEK